MSDIRFYDAHLHTRGEESGGFLVGLEGTPWFDGTLHNNEAEQLADGLSGYQCFRYVSSEMLSLPMGNWSRRNKCLKYHPRREKYTPSEVVGSIKALQPDVVMIDTLNEPFWTSYDYWHICRAFPEKMFILPHAGGYSINDFIKICHFQKNVWIDFSLTHTYFGGISPNPLPLADEAIRYSLSSPFSERVLLGSDLPFFDQTKVVPFYARLNKLDMLNDNFERLLDMIRH